MNKILFLFLSFFALQNTTAQSTLISGKVVIDDIDYHVDLDNFSIINLNTNAKTTTNSDGIFSIKVNLNDELLFKNEGIEERVLKISENIISKGFITVHLNEMVIELEEASILSLSQDKLKNLGKNKSFGEKLNDEMGFNSPEFQKLLQERYDNAKILRKKNPYEGNILEIFTMFKKGKESGLLKSNKISVFEQLNQLKSIIGETFFIQELKIPREEIIDFMGKYYDSNNFKKLIKRKQFDKIKTILKSKVEEYNQLRYNSISSSNE